MYFVISGIRPLKGYLSRISAGALFVVVCGVDRYALRNVYISCVQFFFSTCAILSDFFKVLINLSASPFALGQQGVNFFNCSLLNGDPLSLFTVTGVPNIENTLSKAGMTALADVVMTISMTGYLE